MLLAKFRSNLVWVTVTKHQWYRDSFFNLFSSMLISSKLDRFIETFRSTMIRVTERALELPFDNKFLALTFDHLCFYTFTASSLTAAHQINRLSVFKVELKLADRTFQERGFEGLHYNIT
jgi:hypothetical protein